jgi:hypothetical protein
LPLQHCSLSWQVVLLARQALTGNVQMPPPQAPEQHCQLALQAFDVCMQATVSAVQMPLAQAPEQHASAPSHSVEFRWHAGAWPPIPPSPPTSSAPPAPPTGSSSAPPAPPSLMVPPLDAPPLPLFEPPLPLFEPPEFDPPPVLDVPALPPVIAGVTSSEPESLQASAKLSARALVAQNNPSFETVKLFIVKFSRRAKGVALQPPAIAPPMPGAVSGDVGRFFAANTGHGGAR